MLGKIDSPQGGLRARFEVLPDAPVTKFTMTLTGGESGILANATDTCANPQVATAKFIGQDNGIETLRPTTERVAARRSTARHKKAKGGRR